MAARDVRGAGVELVCSERVLARDQPEIRTRHQEVQEAQLPAHRTVALEDFDLFWSLDLETHLAAVASAAMSGHRPSIAACRDKHRAIP